MKSWKNVVLALSLSWGSFAVMPSALACDCKAGEKACHCKDGSKDCAKEGHEGKACKHHKHKGGDDKGDPGAEGDKHEAAPAK